MNLVNISNQGRNINLFLRDENNRLMLKKDDSFYPSYYQINSKGEYNGYDGCKLSKHIVQHPKDIKNYVNQDTYLSDINYCKQYIIERIEKINCQNYIYGFIDIECYINKDIELDPNNPVFPISCITLYHSKTKEYKTWFILDYDSKNLKKAEISLLYEFVCYLKKYPIDLLLGWNIDGFDYPYIYKRLELLPQDYFFEKQNKYNNFASLISPIQQVRYKSNDYNLFYPAGISIVDYMGLYAKVYPKTPSLALHYVLEEQFGKGKENKDVDFTELTEQIKSRNLEDVVMMNKLEEKTKLLSYYNTLRNLTLCLWEDLPMKITYKEGKQQKISNNSRLVDMIALKEAYKQNIILPNAPEIKSFTEEEKEQIKGAYRESFIKGLLKNIGKYDLSSAYPNMIVNFCLDTSNIVEDIDNYNESYPLININGIFFKQNEEALIPKMVKKLMKTKDELKEYISKLDINSQEYEQKKLEYSALKSLVNSQYGVLCSNFYRLYNPKVGSSITFLARDLLHYILEELKKLNYEVIYLDTDSCFLNISNNIVDIMNNLIKKWAKEKYNNDNVTVEFIYEGFFKSLIVKELCHYIGYLQTDKGIEEEMKGIEAKKSNATKFVKYFQKKLLNKILDEEKQEDIINWIKDEIGNFRNKPLDEIAFPTKLSRNLENYNKNTPVFCRALINAKKLDNKFDKKIGQMYYWLYIHPINKKETITTQIFWNKEKLIDINEELDKQFIINNLSKYLTKEQLNTITDIKKLSVKHTKKIEEDNVIAFDMKNTHLIQNIDWENMINKNIHEKVRPIFECLKWEYNLC